MTDTRTNKATVARFFEGTHTGNLDVIDETVAANIVTHGFPFVANPHSRESYKQFFRDFGAIFSDMNSAVSATLAEGDHVAVRFAIEVKHTGDFAGIPATGRTVTFAGMALYRLDAGLIAETWLHVDERAILEQITAGAEAVRGQAAA